MSLIVATYTTLWVPWFGMATFGTYSGWAKMLSSTGSLNARPNVLGATFEVLSVVSARVAPETPASYPRCSTGCAACAIGPNARASAPAIGPAHDPAQSIPKNISRNRMPLALRKFFYLWNTHIFAEIPPPLLGATAQTSEAARLAPYMRG